MGVTLIRQTTLIRKHQIIEAARNLITSRGMESVTMGSIAFAVGLSEGAIYRHFTSKHQILTLLIDDMERTLLNTVSEAQEEGASALENLEHILEAHLTDVEGLRAVSFIVIAEAMAFDGIGLGQRVSSMLTNYLESIQRVLEKGVEEGSIRPDLHVDAAATTFFGIIQSTATLWALNEWTSPLAEWRAQMWQSYKGGVAAPS